MHPMLRIITHRGIVGEKLKNDLYGDAKRELLSKVEMNIRELQLLIDSGQVSESERSVHFKALDALYSAREAVEAISSMSGG